MSGSKQGHFNHRRRQMSGIYSSIRRHRRRDLCPYRLRSVYSGFERAQRPIGGFTAGFFEITATNGNASATMWRGDGIFQPERSGTNLLGGANTGANDAGMNNAAITFAAPPQSAMRTSSRIATFRAQRSARRARFVCNKRVRLPMARETSWPPSAQFHREAARDSSSSCRGGECCFQSPTGNGTGAPDSDNYYYHNFYADSKTAAQFGCNISTMWKKAQRPIVNRVMACNFPDWYRDRLLNNLYPLIQNAVCAKNGRVAFWEALPDHSALLTRASMRRSGIRSTGRVTNGANCNIGPVRA